MVAIVKYNAGNIRSVKNALDRLGVESILTDDPDLLKMAEKVIFPGVGEANSAMKYLKERGLDRTLKSLTQPFLGICLGMQLMCSYSEENDTPCLGIFDEEVKLFPPEELVPHMGWNDFISHSGPLFENISTVDNMYFVHSFYVETGKDTIASTDYILPFSSGLQKDNFYGVQFHPEKSADVGQKLLENFLNLQ
ncbi:MAG: imidazole glycerol phosphate synthase subunit HisH [Cyclobacteriaceae bacterium]